MLKVGNLGRLARKRGISGHLEFANFFDTGRQNKAQTMQSQLGQQEQGFNWTYNRREGKNTFVSSKLESYRNSRMPT